MPVTEEELEQKRQHVAELRDEIAGAEAREAEALAVAEREVQARILDKEAERLEAVLASKEASADRAEAAAEGVGLPIADEEPVIEESTPDSTPPPPPEVPQPGDSTPSGEVV